MAVQSVYLARRLMCTPPEPLACRSNRADNESMARYALSYQGKWGPKFSSLDEATREALQLADQGELVGVIKRRWWRFPQLVAVYPVSRMEEGSRLWKTRNTAASGAIPFLGG
jgi:hypothetical protein